MKIKNFLLSSAVAGFILLFAIALNGCKDEMEMPDTFPVDETFAAELISKGIPEDIARFFAAAKMETSSPNDRTCIYLQTFPNGASRQITLQVDPNPQYAPTPEEIANSTPGSIPIYGFKYSSSVLEDSTIQIDLNYYVAKEGISKGDALFEAAGGTGTTNVVGISWIESWKKGTNVALGSLINYAKAHGIRVGNLGSLLALASALSSVTTSLDISQQINPWLAELDALEKCAANPTNSLTRTDPNYSAAAVAVVQSARFDLKVTNAARYFNIMTQVSLGSTLVTRVLSIGLIQANLWNEQTLYNFCENTIMREARLFVVPCHTGWKLHFFDSPDPSFSCNSPYGPWNITFEDALGRTFSYNIPFSKDGKSTLSFKYHYQDANTSDDISNITNVTITPTNSNFYKINIEATIWNRTSCFWGDCVETQEPIEAMELDIRPADPGECSSH